MKSSLVFDRAVPYYDETRALPASVSDAVARSFIQATGTTTASHILELGVGTGRIALPLLERRLPIVGVDLSLPIMGELVRKTAGRQVKLSLAQADANVLPFPNASFDAAYAVHVFHLVAHWQHALDEAFRVIKPGGCLLVSFHYRRADSENRKIRRKLDEMVKPLGIDTRRPGVQSSEDLKTELDKRAKTHVVSVAQWQKPTTPEEILEDVASQIHSETWAIPKDIMAKVVPDLRAWAQKEFGDLSRTIQEDSQFSWLVACRS